MTRKMRCCSRTLFGAFSLAFAIGPAVADEAPAEKAATARGVNQIQGPAPGVYEAGIRPFHDYWPKTITVPPETTVVWRNTDVAEHNVHVLTGENNPLKDDIKGELAFPGESFAITFHREGNYRYFCDPHPYMQAHVVVEAGAKLEPQEPGAEAPQGGGGATPSVRDLKGGSGPRGGAAAALDFIRNRERAR